MTDTTDTQPACEHIQRHTQYLQSYKLTILVPLRGSMVSMHTDGEGTAISGATVPIQCGKCGITALVTLPDPNNTDTRDTQNHEAPNAQVEGNGTGDDGEGHRPSEAPTEVPH